jgi:hypothetical protein
MSSSTEYVHEIKPIPGCPLTFQGYGELDGNEFAYRRWQIEYTPLFGVGQEECKVYAIVMYAVQNIYPETTEIINKVMADDKAAGRLPEDAIHPFQENDEIVLKHMPHEAWKYLEGGRFIPYSTGRTDLLSTAIAPLDPYDFPIIVARINEF